jgi:phenylacetate-CoA ligase
MVYGSSEGGYIAGECEQEEGMHILSDYYIVEVIDPDTEEVLGPGEDGEIVITPLWNEAMPLIRYRMGDVGSLFPFEPCPCGRTHPKISMVRGRVAHIIKVKDKKILPIDIEEVLASIPGLGNEHQIIMSGVESADGLKVKIETSPEIKELKRLKEQTEEALHQRLGIETEVELIPSGSLDRANFKAQRFITA